MARHVSDGHRGVDGRFPISYALSFVSSRVIGKQPGFAKHEKLEFN